MPSPRVARLPACPPVAAAAAAAAAGHTAAARPAWRLEDAALWASLVPLLLLTRPYAGIVRDGRIYVGRGLADRDPGGIGRDLMFAMDEQTGFTLFRPVMRALLGILPPDEASMAVAGAGGVVWLAAVVAFVSALAGGRAAWAAAAAVLVLPPGYGGLGAFLYGEVLATPRIFAEAAVLGGLAAFLRGRTAAAAGLLGLACLLHPLMALPGGAVAALAWLAEAPRRRLVPALLAGGSAAAAALWALPIGERLLRPIDPDWMSVLRPSRYLFPSLWPPETWGQIVAQAVAVGVAGSLLGLGRGRTVLWATVGVAAGGLALAAAFEDRLPLVLATQLQVWRATWLLAVAGHAALALSAFGLWRRGRAGRLALALLGLTWLAADSLPVALCLGAATIAAHAAGLRGLLEGVSGRVVAAAGLAVAALAASQTWIAATLAADLLRAGAEAGVATPWNLLLTLEVQTWPLAACVLAVALVAPRPWPSPARAAAAASVAAGLAAGAWLWDAREPDQRALGPGPQVAELRRLLSGDPGEVLWLGGDVESWFWAGRPGFASMLQRGPALFSRPLALRWEGRIDGLLATGLLRRADVDTWDGSLAGLADVAPSSAAIGAFCRDPARPAALVAAGDHRAAVPAGLAAHLWRGPAPVWRLGLDGGRFRWWARDVYTVVACRAEAPGRGSAEVPRAWTPGGDRPIPAGQAPS